MFRGKVKGRKGEWLGLRMDETVGDCDGALGGERYFTCEDAQGLFIRWESGRLVAAPERATIPEPVLKHMLALFEMCDGGQTGGLDVSELLQAMQMLGQSVTRKDVQPMFKRIVTNTDRVSTRKDAIDFDEFRQLMEERWVGVDLAAVVQSIKDDEEEERRQQEETARAALEQDMIVDVMGVSVDLKYFGTGTNVGFLVVYGFLALAVVAQLYLHVPEDMLTFLMIAVLGGTAALFGIGCVAIKSQNWPLVKLYAVLLFFAAGMQVAVCIMFKVGVLRMSTSIVREVMDRECGTCIGGGRCATVGDGILLSQGDGTAAHEQPWYCCCAYNECRGSELVVQSQATCEDGCALADLTGSESESRSSCLAQDDQSGVLTNGCAYIAATDAVCARGPSCLQDDPSQSTLPDECYTAAGVPIGGNLPLCPDVTSLGSDAASAACLAADGCEYTPGAARTCTQTDEAVRCDNYAQSESACASAGVCVFTSVEYTSQVSLSIQQEATKQMCHGRDEYMDFARLHAYPVSSVLGEEQCFDRNDDPNEASGYGGLVGCLDSYQSSIQVWYLVFQMAMLPMVLVAAYIGWVMPDIYIEKVTQSQSQSIDSFLSSLESDVQNFSNPLQDEEAGDRDRSTISDASEAQKTDRHERQTSKEDDIAEGLRQAKQNKRLKNEQKELETLGPYLSGRQMPTNADIAKAKLGAITPSDTTRIAGTAPGSQAEKAGVRRGWLVQSVNGRNVSSQSAEKVMELLRETRRPLSVGFHRPYQRMNAGPVEIIFEQPGELGLQLQLQGTRNAPNVQTATSVPIKVANPLMKRSTDNTD